MARAPNKNYLLEERPLGTRRGARKYVISTEGSKTERDYLKMLQCKFGRPEPGSVSFFFVFAKPNNEPKSDPANTLRFMEEKLKEEGEELEQDDEAWIIVDRDEWKEKQIEPLYAWAEKKENCKNCYVAFSNPCFEVWLLLHFEECKNYRSSKECKSRLKRRFPKCDKKNMKSIYDKIELEDVYKAIERASLRCKVLSAPPRWPGEAGVTTVHELMEKFLPPRPS